MWLGSTRIARMSQWCLRLYCKCFLSKHTAWIHRVQCCGSCQRSHNTVCYSSGSATLCHLETQYPCGQQPLSGLCERSQVERLVVWCNFQLLSHTNFCPLTAKVWLMRSTQVGKDRQNLSHDSRNTEQEMQQTKNQNIFFKDHNKWSSQFLLSSSALFLFMVLTKLSTALHVQYMYCWSSDTVLIYLKFQQVYRVVWRSWVCVCVCGCFGNMCACIYCVLYCVFVLFYIYSYLFCLY